jgi:hypothetical protein
MRHQQRSLIGKVVIQQVDHLHRHVGLARTRRTNNARQALIQARSDGLDLNRREANRVEFGFVIGIRAGVGQREWLGSNRRRLGIERQAEWSLAFGLLQCCKRNLLHRLVEPMAVGSVQATCVLLVRQATYMRREALLQMLCIQERVEVVCACNGLGSARCTSIAIAQEHVVQPRRKAATRIHQRPNGIEGGFEVVLLGLTTNNEIERPVDRIDSDRSRVQVKLVPPPTTSHIHKVHATS